MNSSVATILHLNDKVLCRLCSYLRLEDKLKLLLLSVDRFKRLAQHIIADECLEISDIYLDFTLEEANLILSDYGHLFKKFRFASSFDDEVITEYFNLMPMFCSNLQEICLTGFEITVTNAHGLLLANSTNLKILRLKNCILGNKAGLLISKLANLEVLDLEDSKLTGKGLSKLAKLVDLSLKKCRNFKCGIFIEICKSNRLKRLNIVGFKQLSHAASKVLLKTQDSLEVLVVGNTYWSKDFSKICFLENLREVSIIARDEEVVSNYLAELIVKHEETLQSLEVYLQNVFCNYKEYLMQMAIQISRFGSLRALSFRNCPLFEDPHLVQIAKSLAYLEMLDLSGTSFNDVGIVGCVEYLDNLRYLDISHCQVKKSLYSKLICVRKERRFLNRLLLFVNSGHPLVESKQCAEWQNYVAVTTASMRLRNESSTILRLHELNTKFFGISNQLSLHHLSSKPDSFVEENAIFKLGENCLYHIFKYLRVLDKLTLILTSEAFSSVTKYFLRTELVNMVEIMSHFTVRETRKILSRCGSMIKRLRVSASIYHYTPEYFYAAAQYCKNLEEIQCYVGITEKLAETCTSLMMASSNTLKVIKMNHWDANDQVVSVVANVINLQTLLLTSPRATGLHLEKLTNLRVLELSQCGEFEPKYFIGICRSNRLIKLDIKGCRKLNAACFDVLAETQDTLERLSIGGVYAATNIYVLAQLKRLKDIELQECATPDASSLMNALAKHRQDQIEALSIDCTYVNDTSRSTLSEIKGTILNFPNILYLRLHSSDMVDNEYMKRIVVACPKIRVLDVQGANHLDNTGILEAAVRLENLRCLDIKFCNFSDSAKLYQEIVKVKRCRIDEFPLVLDIRSREENLDCMLNTKEYNVTANYVQLSKDSSCDMRKDEYLKPRPGKRCPHKSRLCPENTVRPHRGSLEISILYLPDSCLSRISLQLPSIDQLKLASVHHRFFLSIRPIVKDIMFDLNEISEHFTVDEAKLLFAKCGNQIQRIKYTVMPNNNPIAYLDLFEPYKKYFKEIVLDNSHHVWSWEAALQLITSTQRLEKIVLRDYYTLEPLLAEVTNGCGGYFDLFKNLTELHLTDCYPLQTTDFILICQNCKLLALDIRGCSQLQNDAFVELIAWQTDHLERIAVSCDYIADNYSDVSYLARLQHITIECYSNLSQLELILDKLVKARRNDMHSLEIQNIKDTNRVFDYGLIFRIVEERCRKFSKLQKININQAGPYVKPYHY